MTLVPSYLYVVGVAALVAAWFKYVDCDLLTFVCSLRGVHKPAVKAGVVWVLGASSGIGEELSMQLADLGAKVVLSARRRDELERIARACREKDAGFNPLVLPLDVLDFSAHKRAVDQIIEAYGAIDMVVLNVGRTQRALAGETELGVSRQMLELNTLAQISLAQAVLPTFTKQGSGTFVVTSSVSGKFGAPVASSYCASKFALHGYFDSLRLELADKGIRVCMVCPGPVATPIEAAAFTGVVGGVRGRTTEALSAKMSVRRCALLMLAAITRGVDECWITQNPVLLFTYMAQYAPDLHRLLGKRWFGPMRTKAFKEGKDIFGFKNMVAGGGGAAEEPAAAAGSASTN